MINDELIGPKLAAPFTTTPIRRERNLSQTWEAAYIQDPTNFPATLCGRLSSKTMVG